MSSSRSDDVTKSVCVSACVCVIILLSLEHSKQLKLNVPRVLQGVSRVYKGCLKHISWVLVSQGSSKVVKAYHKGVSRIFASFIGVRRKFQGCFLDVSLWFKLSFNKFIGVSLTFQGCFKSLSEVFQGNFNVFVVA